METQEIGVALVTFAAEESNNLFTITDLNADVAMLKESMAVSRLLLTSMEKANSVRKLP